MRGYLLVSLNPQMRLKFETYATPHACMGFIIVQYFKYGLVTFLKKRLVLVGDTSWVKSVIGTSKYLTQQGMMRNLIAVRVQTVWLLPSTKQAKGIRRGNLNSTSNLPKFQYLTKY